jgi:hypothetical protein
MLRDKAAQVGYLNIGLLSKDRRKTMKTCRLYQVDAFTSDPFLGIRSESRPLTQVNPADSFRSRQIFTLEREFVKK